ncbi:MAG: hypothetical protein IGR92_10570 [Leptolyngbyaceae cyanobacterium T60_A2020_046]|nr:hypothetical protein [Leptolyngbyaceae cyanobacterium T60_A2020_046]
MTVRKHSLLLPLLGSLLGAGALSIAAPAIAQDAGNIDPLEGYVTTDEGYNPFGNSGNPFELIHRAILAPSISGEEFRNQQGRRITSEAEAFRLRQQEILRQQQDGAAAEEPATAVEGDLL